MKSPHITHIAETALYSDSLGEAETFYRDVLQFEVSRREDRFIAFRVTAQQELLVFARGASAQDMEVDGGVVTGHDGSGPLHLCFGIRGEQVQTWEQRLSDHGIPIENRVSWPCGTRSLYFRDPDGHVIELVTPGLWDAPAGI